MTPGFCAVILPLLIFLVFLWHWQLCWTKLIDRWTPEGRPFLVRSLSVCLSLWTVCLSLCGPSVVLGSSSQEESEGVLIGPCRQVINSAGMCCSYSDANDQDGPASHPQLTHTHTHTKVTQRLVTFFGHSQEKTKVLPVKIGLPLSRGSREQLLQLFHRPPLKTAAPQPWFSHVFFFHFW